VDEETVVELSSVADGAVRVYPEAGTRHLLAIILAIGMTVAMLMVVFGGLIGRFDATLVGAVCAPYGTAFAAAAYFYFKNRRQLGRGSR
jgi:hypothetical protein